MNDIGNRLRKGYDEGCIAAHALDSIGDRWTLLIVREMMLGAKRFGALRAGMPGISANILTQRLGEMELAGIVRRMVLPPPASVQVYALTGRGLALRPVIDALCRWGAEMPGHDPTRFISPTSLMLSMAAMINARAAQGLTMTVGFHLGGESFAVHMAGGQMHVSQGDAAAADLHFSGGTNALARVIYGRLPLLQAVAQTGIGFAGDPVLGQRFVDLFSLRRAATDIA